MIRPTCKILALVACVALPACTQNRADTVNPDADYVGAGNGSSDVTRPSEKGDGYGSPGVTGSAGSYTGGPGGALSGGPEGSGSTGGAGSVGGDLPGDPGGPQAATTGTGIGTTGTSQPSGSSPRGVEPGRQYTPDKPKDPPKK
jgi:hypothetical protein